MHGRMVLKSLKKATAQGNRFCSDFITFFRYYIDLNPYAKKVDLKKPYR